MSALGLGLLAALSWGIHDITIRYLSRSVPLLGALFVVLLVGTVFQMGMVWMLSGAVMVAGSALWLSIGAGLAFLVASLGLYYAFERGPVRLVAPVIASYPILSIGFALLAGATITVLQGVAVLAIVAGVGIVAMLSDHATDHNPPFGPTIALSIMAAIGFASTFKLGQLAAEIAGELPTTLIALLCLAAVIAIRRAPFFPSYRAIWACWMASPCSRSFQRPFVASRICRRGILNLRPAHHHPRLGFPARTDDGGAMVRVSPDLRRGGLSVALEFIAHHTCLADRECR